MRSSALALFLAAPIFCASPCRAGADAAPAPSPSAGSQAAEAGAPQVSAEAAARLRAEIERLRRESEEQRRAQEQRIRALEEKLQQIQEAPKPAAPETQPAAPPKPAPNPVTSRPGFKTRLYGFLRADADADSRKMFAGSQLPFWVLSPADPRARNRTDGDFTLHPRLSRVGLDTQGPVDRLGGAKLTGKLEIDFFNILPDKNSATSNSRQLLRIRHAYGQLEWENMKLLFGQTWDLISPLYPAANYDVVMWNAGNLGDRRPQLRFTWEPRVRKGKASLAVAAGSSSAIDGADLDGDQNLDGEESGRPTVQVRAAINQPSWVKSQTWELGLWAHNGAFRIDRAKALAGRRTFSSDAVGFDVRVPLLKRLLLQGEAWLGKNLADVRGGVGQNMNLVTGQDIRSRGGWAELLYQVAPFYTFGGGFTVDDPTNSDVTPFTGANQTSVGRTLNRSYYIVNHFNLGSGLQLGVDWMLFHTSFRGLPEGENNRWNIWLQHNF